MFSKTVILSFCMALYFLQCQVVANEPNEEQVYTIGRIVGGLYVPNAVLTYEQLIIFFNHVKQTMNANGDLPSRLALETLLEASTFTEEIALTYATYILGDDINVKELVEPLIRGNLNQGSIDFSLLVGIISVVKHTLQMVTSTNGAVELKAEMINDSLRNTLLAVQYDDKKDAHSGKTGHQYYRNAPYLKYNIHYLTNVFRTI
ncbi:uncharacterized protein LOC126842062 [Adelges cooleyi]|uniref:uncharacterized protein LOC126842062 n=1 Tax=Adelges cooleyi TaxID=133065 RepID=UPI00218062D0|nr:uncharacterized protein LOC126842062 [Adelges cooleyi]